MSYIKNTPQYFLYEPEYHTLCYQYVKHFPVINALKPYFDVYMYVCVYE